MGTPDFILCYRKPHEINWDCECGYKSVAEVNNRVKSLSGPDMTTTFFTYSSSVPLGMRQMLIQNALTPKINMYAQLDGERKPITSIKSFYKPKSAYF